MLREMAIASPYFIIFTIFSEPVESVIFITDGKSFLTFEIFMTGIIKYH
jgi:hypothetical protein